MSKHESPHKVKLGDDYQYPIKESGEASYKHLNMKDVLYVPGLKKNLLSISSLDEKGIRVAFVDDQVLIWSIGNTLEDAAMIGEEDIGLCKLMGQPK